MRIDLEARAAGTHGASAVARIHVDPATRAGGPPPWVSSAVATLIATAGAVTALPGISARLPARAVLVLHFVATVGTSAQPLIVTIVAALIAALEHGVRGRFTGASRVR